MTDINENDEMANKIRRLWDEGHQQLYDARDLAANHLTSGKPLSRSFRDLLIEMLEADFGTGKLEPEPEPKYPPYWCEIGQDFSELTSIGNDGTPLNSEDKAYEILSERYDVSVKIIKSRLAFYNEAAAKLETEEIINKPDNKTFELIPEGIYKMKIIDSKITDTKSGTGKVLTFTEEIIEEKYAGRQMLDNINVQNENPEARRIAQRSLADLCLAVGINDELSDTEQLHSKPFMGHIIVVPSKDPQYGFSNKVRYIHDN